MPIKAPTAWGQAAGDSELSFDGDILILRQSMPSVNRRLLRRYQEFVILSAAVDICLNKSEHPDTNPDERALLRRLHDIFARHGMAVEEAAA